MSPFGNLVVIIYTEKLTKMDIKRDLKYELFEGLLKRHVGVTCFLGGKIHIYKLK